MNDFILSRSLFTYVNEAGFSGPTYSAYIALLDNYNALIGIEETPNSEEERAFLDAIMETEPMQKCQQYLVDIGEFGALTFC